MRKSLIAIVAILVIAIAAAVFYVFSNLDAIVKAAIEQHGSDAVKTSVQVDQVAIKLADGAAAITGLTVANPEGFSLPQAFSLGEIAIDIDLEKTGKELIAIDTIDIAAPRIYYEINAQRQGSLNVLKENLATGAGATDGTTADGEPQASTDAAPLKLDIARFELKQASLHAKVVPLTSAREYFTQDPSDPDAVEALVFSAEAGSAWSLVYPQFSVAVPRPAVIKQPLAYAVALGSRDLARFLDQWILLKQRDGTVDRLFEHWITGERREQAGQRWSVIRDVLGWVD